MATTTIRETKKYILIYNNTHKNTQTKKQTINTYTYKNETFLYILTNKQTAEV